MPDIQLNGQSITTTSATTAPSSGTSETWTVTTLPSTVPTLLTNQTYALIDATSGATTSQQAEIVRVTAATTGGTSITVTRGADSTTPVAHAATSTFNLVLVESHLNNVRAGYPPSYVGGGKLLSNTYDRRLQVYNWKQSNTRNLTVGLARAASNLGSTGHLIIGESTSDSYIGYAYDQLHMWPIIMRDSLNQTGYTTGGSGFIRCGSVVADTGTQTYGHALDPRWTFSAGCITSGAAYVQLNGSGNYGTLIFDKACTQIDVWYLNNSGPFTISIDSATSGTKFASVTPTGTVVWSKTTFTGLNTAKHTVRITQTSAANVVLKGVSGTGINGVYVHNMAEGGSKASDWGSTSILTLLGMTTSVIPTSFVNVIHIATGINSIGASESLSSIATNITTIRNQYPAADCILHAQYQPGTITLATWQGYIASLYQLADTLDCPLIDLLDRSGGYTNAYNNLMMGDGVHPNLPGQWDWAAALVAAFSSVPNPLTASVKSAATRTYAQSTWR